MVLSQEYTMALTAVEDLGDTGLVAAAALECQDHPSYLQTSPHFHPIHQPHKVLCPHTVQQQ